MDNRIYRSYDEPKREGLSWNEYWKAEDKGLIKCWEVGRELRQREPAIARLAEQGELPLLGWKGGVDKNIKKREKFGVLFYLAQWQGLRGDDLDIDLNEEIQLTCSRTGIRVIYTNDIEKYGGE